MAEVEWVSNERAVARVVHPLASVAKRPCARPACPSPATATLRFAYARQEAWLDLLSEESDPQSYDLCATHAGRTCPPHGWRLRDRRPEEDRVSAPVPPPRDLGGERTVAVLAAALRAVPGPTAPTGPRSDSTAPMVASLPADAGDRAAAEDGIDDDAVTQLRRDVAFVADGDEPPADRGAFRASGTDSSRGSRPAGPGTLLFERAASPAVEQQVDRTTDTRRGPWPGPDGGALVDGLPGDDGVADSPPAGFALDW